MIHFRASQGWLPYSQGFAFAFLLCGVALIGTSERASGQESFFAEDPVSFSEDLITQTNDLEINQANSSEVWSEESPATFSVPSAVSAPSASSSREYQARDDWFLILDTPYTSQMLDFQNRQGDKEVILLDNSYNNDGQTGFILGAQFRGSGLFGRTNTANKFNYLGRFPPDFTGTTASDIRLLQANQNVTAHFNPKIHGYFETLFSDVFSFDTFNQGSFQVRQAYLVFGDFEQSPYYAYIGKKNVSFGSMATLSPFTQAVPWHYFAPLAEGAGVGFDNQRVNATLTALNGSRGIRVVDSPRLGQINNFAANILLRTPFGNDSQFDIGAGYLHGTIYNNEVAEHTDEDLFGPNNGAFDVNARLRIRRLQLAAEYVQTLDPWPATEHEVIAYSAEAAYDMRFAGMPARSSFSWSEGIQGQPGTQFEFNRQMVIGMSVRPHRNTLLTFEYVRGTGFAPLIAIQRVSDINVVQNSFVFGASLSL